MGSHCANDMHASIALLHGKDFRPSRVVRQNELERASSVGVVVIVRRAFALEDLDTTELL